MRIGPKKVKNMQGTFVNDVKSVVRRKKGNKRNEQAHNTVNALKYTTVM